MNSMINRSRLLAAALCATVLAGCNAVEDVADEPSADLPKQTVVLGGHIKDLGSRRPLVLQYNGTDTCLVPANSNDPTGKRVISECRFLGIADQELSSFSFGALPVGTPYNITVKRQPFGKICTVQNPSGTVSADAAEILVSCVDDSAVPHYTVTVNVAAAAASKPGLQVTLTTENGTCPVDVNGRTSITFSPSQCPDSAAGGYHRNAAYVFNSQLNLPVFQWRVTASIPGATAVAPRTNCFVTGGPVANTGGNVQDDGTAAAGTAPTGNITTVNVVSCGFTVRVQADYSRPAGVTTDPAIASGDGVLVALRSQPTGVDVASAKITSFANTFIPFMVPDASGNPTATAYEAQSDPNAFYELVVKSSPAGMACIPGSSVAANSTRTVGALTDAGAVLLRTPSSATVPYVWIIDRVIRCRLTPATAAARLRGVYWQYTTTTTTTTVGANAGTVTNPTVLNRNLLAFFEDGTYLYGNHSATAANNGVEQGFYTYDTATNQIVFTGITDTNGASGLNNAGAARTITGVVKSSATPKTITARVSNTTVSGLVLSSTASTLTVSVNNGQAFDVAPATYTTANFATLVTNINNASPGSGTIAAASGGEIRITAPAGGIVFGGSAVTTLGLPASVPAGTTVTSTNVANTLATVVNTIVDWKLQEVGADPSVSSTNPVDGAWVLWDWQRQPAPVEDRRRIFVYQHGLYNAFHVGVNGIGNLQEACFVGDFGLSGTWTRQGARSGCNIRVYTERSPPINYAAACAASTTGNSCTLLSSGSADIPNATTILKDYPGRWPQSQNPEFTDGRPYSLVDYEVRLAGTVPSDPVCPTMDKLTVWDTLNGVRKDTLTPAIPRLVLCRITAN